MAQPYLTAMKALEERARRQACDAKGWYKRVMARGELSCAVSVERDDVLNFVTMCC